MEMVLEPLYPSREGEYTAGLLRVAMQMHRCSVCAVVDLRGDVCLAGPELGLGTVMSRYDAR